MERFALAKDLGFEAVEAFTTFDRQEAQVIKEASEATHVRIHSLTGPVGLESSFSSIDSDVIKKDIEGTRAALDLGNFWRADTVLTIPAQVTPETSYGDAWTRSQIQIRRLIPTAEQAKVIIAIEEVWNKFLLSPLEFATYIDQFDSAWVKAYFDIGNVVLYGYPQDWIRTLNKRIVKIHLKDFDRKTSQFVDLGEGSVDWTEVRKALEEIRYSGYVTVEFNDLTQATASQLRDVSKRIDRFILGVE
jgi:hexulose-6-phosphate isomerase